MSESTRRGQRFDRYDRGPTDRTEVWETSHARIAWQTGVVSEHGPNGHQPQEVLELAAERLRRLNAEVPARETSEAITHVEAAILWLDERTRDRIARGVEGTHQR